MARHKRSGGRKKCRLPRTPLPLKILRPEEEEDPQPQSRNKMAMQIESSTFKLPRDWVVRKVRRASGKSCGLIDKYYYEPETGRQFRSLKSIQKYLTEKMENTPKILGPDKEEEEEEQPHQKMAMQIMDPNLELPDNWVFQKRLSSSGQMHKYYYEPGTGRQFRSLKSVQRHLIEANDCTHKPSQNSDASKKNNSSTKVKTSTSHFIKPPKKVNWVLTGPGGDVWSPYINASAVPESIKQTWAKIFMLHVNEKF
ncbi:methyl-CpG-binding domain-containing protein 7 isoform X2 [Vitis riparia]|uniref:methyl-CpG-binding domain-containing protein 7 isoform X2 n=1 Tax=Vitis riparia TaxID=96939 RepID=UPI00155A9AC2|nr:methyl-CpG-binding domain-containing protein 7 isoform X2 [Vitis riparia]